MSLGPHASFILASYAIVVAVIAALIAWLVADGRRQARHIADLEARGVRRRSSGQGAGAPAGKV